MRDDILRVADDLDRIADQEAREPGSSPVFAIEDAANELRRLAAETEAQLDAIFAALDAHDAEWAHRHISKRPGVPLALREAINNARKDHDA